MNINEFIKKYESYKDPTTVSLQLSISTYFDAIRAIVENISKDMDFQIIYISSTIPSKNIMNVLDVFGIDHSNMFFVDCISYTMMTASLQNEKVAYVESPTMLETVMLKTQYIIKKFITKKALVIVDSINSLAIHNDIRILSEFLHLFVTYLRSENVYFIIFSMKEQSGPDLLNIMNLVSDEILFLD